MGIADRYAGNFTINDEDDINISGSGSAMDIKISPASTFTFTTGNNRKFVPGDEIRFRADGLINKAYSPWQKMIFADSPASRSQYFYAYVTEFTPSIGQMSCVVLSDPPPLGLDGGYIKLFQYATVEFNLGGLGSSGAIGLTGPSGLRGNTGNALFVINQPVIGLVEGVNTLNFNVNDALDLYFTGYNNTISLNYDNFQTGQMVLLNIRHSGDITITNNAGSILSWDAGIYFPGNVAAPAPVYGTCSIYTLVRYPNKNGNKRIFCTYSSNYSV